MDTRVRTIAALAIGWLALSGLARADAAMEEHTRTKFAGTLGTILKIAGQSGEGTTQTVAVHGDRRRTLGEDGGEIVDLREEKIYRLDARAKTYEVVTFAELRRQAREAAAEARRSAEKQPRAEANRPKQEEKPAEPDVAFDVDVKETGQHKTVNGFDARQVVTTVTIHKKGQTLEQSGGTVITADAWLAARVKAHDELLAFERRYATQLYGRDAAGARGSLAALEASAPGVGAGMEKVAREGARLRGVPVLTTTTIEGVRSAEELASAREKQRAEPSSGGTGFGGLIGKAIAKKVAPASEPKARELFMTTTAEVLRLTTEVSASDVAIPAGYHAR